MIGIIITVIFLCVFLAVPLVARIVLFILNAFIPDPIPYADECVMAGNIVHNLVRLDKIINFIMEHKSLSLVIIFKYL